MFKCTKTMNISIGVVNTLTEMRKWTCTCNPGPDWSRASFTNDTRDGKARFLVQVTRTALFLLGAPSFCPCPTSRLSKPLGKSYNIRRLKYILKFIFTLSSLIR